MTKGSVWNSAGKSNTSKSTQKITLSAEFQIELFSLEICFDLYVTGYVRGSVNQLPSVSYLICEYIVYKKSLDQWEFIDT